METLKYVSLTEHDDKKTFDLTILSGWSVRTNTSGKSSTQHSVKKREG